MNKYILDLKQCYPYFYEHIIWGNTLSKMIVEKIDYFNGKLFTFLPENANFEQMNELGRGGVIPAELKGVGLSGKGYWEKIPSTRSVLIQFIKNFLSKSSLNYCIGEEVTLHSTDSNIDLENVKSLFNKEEVYYILSDKNISDEIEDVICTVDAHYHLLIILASGPHEFLDDSIDFEQISEDACYLIGGAYDGESYMIWSPSA